ncbi:MAG: peptide chain release factor N(5)-glutamine methyltransferase [Pseudomonadota bacterium]
MTTRAELLARATRCLADAGVPGAERDARLILRWAGGLSGAALQVSLSEVPRAEEMDRFEQGVAARASRRPLSHITGTRAFWGREFLVTPDVLDPRPETEVLVAEALREHASRVLDLGTGSGCILLSLLAEWQDATGVGLDNSAAALKIAGQNAKELGLQDRMELIHGDWSLIPSEPFDLIVSNPPYLSAREWEQAQPELNYEPAGALSPGKDGLEAYHALIAPAFEALRPHGRLILEIGASQADSVLKIMMKYFEGDAAVIRDLDGRDRVVRARKADNS